MQQQQRTGAGASQGAVSSGGTSSFSQYYSARHLVVWSDSHLGTGRVLREITLEDPIRYSAGDPVERWLNELLCLDASVVPKVPTGCPAPEKCELCVIITFLATRYM